MSRELRETLAATRFGYGLTPGRDHVPADRLLQSVTRSDAFGQGYPTPTVSEARRAILDYADARRENRKGDRDAVMRTARSRVDAMARQSLDAAFLRAIDGRAGFRERLIHFWADHFALTANGPRRAYLGSYLFGAIGGNLSGRFADMLRAVATHPLMISYLDQDRSVGPNSRIGRRRGIGLNENYARELMELHTLGSRGAYGQADVRQMAELLTGLTYSHRDGVRFVADRAEPGAERVLDRRYGGQDRPRLEDIHAALDDLSVHPDTAWHLARKLATHFVADRPDPALVAHLQAAWTRTDGDLPSVHAALLEHPAAWDLPQRKVKRPFDFVVSSLRALGIGSSDLIAAGPQTLRRHVLKPLDLMGQPPFRPPGPDGWSDEAEAWITPPGLATRIRWAMDTPGRLLDRLPHPVAFAEAALGPLGSSRLGWAASVSETRAQGVGLVLSSPDFNRR